MSVGEALTAGGMIVTVIVWLVRLEGRVNAQAQLHEKLVDDVTYIRNRIDKAINGRH